MAEHHRGAVLARAGLHARAVFLVAVFILVDDQLQVGHHDLIMT